MKKRILAMMMAVVLGAMLLTGCFNKESKETQEAAAQPVQEQEASSAEPTAEPTAIVYEAQSEVVVDVN